MELVFFRFLNGPWFSFFNMFCACLLLSLAVKHSYTQWLCFPACYPFPNRESVKCVAPRTEDKCRPQRLSHVLRATECFLQTPSFILHHQRHSRFFFFFGKMTNGLYESKGRDTSGLGMSQQFEISWVNPWLPVVGIWVSSEEHEWGGVSWDCTKQKTSLSKLWFLSRDSHEAKGRQFSLLLSIFFSCCSHYKSTSKGSPPLTICCIVS